MMRMKKWWCCRWRYECIIGKDIDVSGDNDDAGDEDINIVGNKEIFK